MGTERILVVDDELAVRKTLQFLLTKAGFSVDAVYGGEEALARFQEKVYALVLLDIRLGTGMDGHEVLQRMLEFDPEVRVIMISSLNDVGTIVKTMRLGALDFVDKPVAEEALLFRVEKLLRGRQLERENELLKSELEAAGTEIVGEDARLRDLLLRLDRAADNLNLNILITGESGTGKELFARHGHRTAARKSRAERWPRPLVTVNCAAIPDTLIESTLFGHVKGAFTGALESRRGKFELAQGGDIFLDEIGSLDLKLQAKLLRVIQEKEVERVGSNCPIQIDFRVIAATNSRLENLVREGKFREDLLFRLRGVEIHVPPLRERGKDAVLLVEYFLERHRVRGEKVRSLSPSVREALLGYAWPGNVREAEIVAQNLVLDARGEEIVVSDLHPRLRGLREESERGGVDLSEGLVPYLERVERDLLARAVGKGGNLQETADLLKIPRSTLRSKLEKFRLG